MLKLDFGFSNIEAFKIIRKKMQVLESIMEKSLMDRDRVAASKELTKYIDHLIIPNKKGNIFANNMMLDNSRDKHVINNQIDFNKLPGMDNEELSHILPLHHD